MTHRYQVGQMLEMRSSPRVSNRPAGLCQVLFCLPHDSGPVLYRVKALNENNERIVDETDLAPTAATRPEDDAKRVPFSIAIARR